MARYVQRGRSRGQSRGTGQGRYEQLRGRGGGGGMIAAMILGALLIVSIMLTITVWISHGNTSREFNDFKIEAARKANAIVQEVDDSMQDARVKDEITKGCPHCLRLQNERDGRSRELRIAWSIMTPAQKAQMRAKYELIALNDKVDYVTDPNNPNLQLIQMTFTVKNQSGKQLGNIHGLFKLFDGKKVAWQKNFTIDRLNPGVSKDMMLTAPGHVKWTGWYCDLYPHLAPDIVERPRR